MMDTIVSSVAMAMNGTTSHNDSVHVTTDDGPWYTNWNRIPYPGSGYTQLGLVLLAFFITCIMILIVIGNMLVCIAIGTERSLKTVQNWFIASLAISDLGLGLVIMPFSLAYELMGYWIFGDIWCEVSINIIIITFAYLANYSLSFHPWYIYA